MPALVQREWNGLLHHYIDYSEKPAAPFMGKENARLKITDADTLRGLDALVRENFLEAVPPQDQYHGA